MIDYLINTFWSLGFRLGLSMFIPTMIWYIFYIEYTMNKNLKENEVKSLRAEIKILKIEKEISSLAGFEEFPDQTKKLNLEIWIQKREIDKYWEEDRRFEERKRHPFRWKLTGKWKY